jgi:hypothetical protein
MLKVEKLSNRIYYKIKYNRNSESFPDYKDFIVSLFVTNKDKIIKNPAIKFPKSFFWQTYNDLIETDCKRLVTNVKKSGNERCDYDVDWFNDCLIRLENEKYIKVFDKHFILI